MNNYLSIAIEAATLAGDEIEKSSKQVGQIKVINKTVSDFVSEVDRTAEKTITKIISDNFPSHQILGEEYGSVGGSDKDFQWIIDPLDGTTNFLRSIPHFAVSIAMLYKNELEIAIIYDPIKNDLFTAQKGQGAFLNQEKISVSQQKNLQGALLATGIPFRDETMHQLEEFTAAMEKFVFSQTSGIRRLGSAALDLAYVACGRFDGYWEANVKPWDIAAGILLITEAGGVVSDLQGGEDYLQPGNLLAAPKDIHKEMLAVTKASYLTDHSVPKLSDALLVSGKVIRGHGVASGTGSDKTYPESTIAMQMPHFKERGLDLSSYFLGTINVSIAPYEFKMLAPKYHFPDVEWTAQIPPETFSFSPCELVFNQTSYECLIYYPHPETKVVHGQPPSMLEIIGPKIDGIRNGSEIELRLNPKEISLVN